MNEIVYNNYDLVAFEQNGEVGSSRNILQVLQEES